jgi:hypothetical protein
MVPPNTRAVNVALETRPRQYPRRAKANLIRKNGKKEHTDDPGGTGLEIVREVRACPACAAARGAIAAER